VTLIKRVKQFFGQKAASDEVQLRIIPRDEHNISRTNISEPALKVLYRLRKAGYGAYLVGGGVRDNLLSLSPKDFDVATDATPEQVNNLFRNSRLIGRRFKLVHVVFGREVIEVATFRAPPSEEHSDKVSRQGDQGMILRDNVYGNKDEDAMRRDFTINALYYNIEDFSVHAYAGGWEDMQAKRIRLIGDPETRYREDPVRMLRAIRFAVKLGFTIDQTTAAPIREMAPLLEQIPAARLFEESLKLILAGNALETVRMLREYNLFAPMFPGTEIAMQDDDYAVTLVENTMANTDARIQAGKSVTPYFFLAALLWPQVCKVRQEYEDQGLAPHPAMQKAADRVLAQQIKAIAIPKRFSIPMREIWEMQLRLPKTRSRRTEELLSHQRFRAAYDFLLLRNQSGEELQDLCDFWTELQEKYPQPERSYKRDDSQRGERGDRNGDRNGERNDRGGNSDGKRRRPRRRRTNNSNNRS